MKQCRNNVVMLCCAKNRCCESSSVTSPLLTTLSLFRTLDSGLEKKLEFNLVLWASSSHILFARGPLFSSYLIILGTLSNDHDHDDNNVKKQLVLWAKQLLCTCITLFSTFLRRPLHEYDVKPPSATFYGGRGHTTTIFPFSIWTWLKPLRIQLQEK